MSTNKNAPKCKHYCKKDCNFQISLIYSYTQSKIASVAQQVEQLIRNQQVAGPNPATSSKLRFATKTPQNVVSFVIYAQFLAFPLPLFMLSNQAVVKIPPQLRIHRGGDAPVLRKNTLIKNYALCIAVFLSLRTVCDRGYLPIISTGSPQNVRFVGWTKGRRVRIRHNSAFIAAGMPLF